MITKREILDAASNLNLNPHVVEKDYALGWVLAGIYAHDALADNWIFKGGTCLKKCYFETYRFSEDLDFTLKDKSHLRAVFLQPVFGEIGEWIHENSGLEFPAKSQSFDIYKNPRGQMSCQGKLSYRGPVSPTAGGMPRIKLDLTADERIVLPPVKVPVFHPYSDHPAGGISVLAYGYEEVFAEKVRALAERTRPRDLYDVINLYRHEDARPAASVLLMSFARNVSSKVSPYHKPQTSTFIKRILRALGLRCWHISFRHCHRSSPFGRRFPSFSRGWLAAQPRSFSQPTRWGPARWLSGSGLYGFLWAAWPSPISKSSALPLLTGCA